MLLLAMRLSLSWLHVRWLAWGRRAIPADLAAKAATLGERLGLRFPPRVCVSEKIREAIVVGLWRPLVLLPASWLTEMTPEVLEAVIAHELAHVRRLDLWVNLLQRLMETLLFYHPAVWWLSRRVSLEREMCADELAVGATSERLVYATALEQLGRMRLGQTSPQFGAGMGGNKMVLLNRVGNILGLSPSTQRARWWPVGLLALAVPLAIWLASMSIVSSTENETRAEEVSDDLADTLSLEARVVGIDGVISNPVEIEIAADDDDPVDTSVNVGNSPKVTVDLIDAVGIEERPSFWMGRERLTREALLDRLGELRDKSPTLQVAIRHTASTEEKELTALRQSLAKLNIQDVSIGRHDLPHVFAYANSKHDGTIRGRVVDAHPTVPSPKYHVMLWHKSWESMSGENPSLVAGAGEAFEFRNVGPGDYELRTREWRPNGRVVHFDANWTYVQTKAAVEDGKVAEVRVVFGKDDTGRWNDAYTWGEAVDGVIMRVTQAKFSIVPGGKIDLHVDIYNGGQTDREIVMNHENWELEIDGQWLKESGGASSGRAVSLLKAKQARHNIDVWAWLGENMTSAVEGLPPGKHTLRVAHLLNGEGRSSNDPPQSRVVSQPVIIDVVAGQPKPNRESGRLVIDLIRTEGSLRQVPSTWIAYELLSEDVLRKRVTEIIEATPEVNVLVRARRQIEHQHVAKLLDSAEDGRREERVADGLSARCGLRPCARLRPPRRDPRQGNRAGQSRRAGQVYRDARTREVAKQTRRASEPGSLRRRNV